MKRPLAATTWLTIATSVAGHANADLQGSEATQPAHPPAATSPAGVPPLSPDLTKRPTLYVVGYAHLDTQWRWTYPKTIREFLPATLNDNFRFFEKYPHYVFNFSGARRYQMMKEYYPEEYARLKEYVAAGRWFPCGSSVDENDANVPSAESLIRHVLYGNRYFRREFGVASEEYMLPDCFGFPAALPSILAHCGIKGFSTQKLTWNAVVPIPFKVGVWEGPDGRGVVAALDPGDYGGEVMENLATSEAWRERIDANGKRSGVYADYHYFGTGDQGGAPTERSVEMIERSIASEGPIRVVSGPADTLFKAITPEMRSGLPRYRGELLLTEHSAGSLTSQAYMKRWNRKNELLADAAERASVAAWWLGGREYPSQKLESAWWLVLGSQMHDILPGTSHPGAYDLAWNDELLAANQFGAVLEDGAGVVAGAMDTRAVGTAVVLFNPLSVDREDVAEVAIPNDLARGGVEVVGPEGGAVPAQIAVSADGSVRVLFLAKVPSVGFAVYDVRSPAAGVPPVPASTLAVEERRLENQRYVVTLDDRGDVASIRDKTAGRELLAAPARLELHYENPRNWPAWNMDWADRQLPVKEHVGEGGQSRAPKFKVLERGPARVAVEVVRELDGSTFTQRVRLCAGGAGDRVEFDTDIDWAARERSLRAAFPLSVRNPVATYDIQVGVIERGNNQPKRYEAPSHQWFDLTDTKGDYGVTVMNDCKYGSDKPADNTLRLTLLHTPGTRGGYQDQGTQDLGRHHVLYALCGHAGDWRRGRSPDEAARLNQPIIAFRSPAHEGQLGRSFSLLRVSDESVRVSAVKKAEEGDEIILRLRECSGRGVRGVKIAMASPIVSAREVDGQERGTDAAARPEIRGGGLTVDLGGFELRAFAVRLRESPVKVSRVEGVPLDLPFDTDAVSTNANRADGAMDTQGRTLPAEHLPPVILSEGIAFRLGPTADGRNNAVTANGQEVPLPTGDFDRLCLLAASSEGTGADVSASMEVDGQAVGVRFRSWTGFIGQWDHRLWLGEVPEQAYSWSNGLGGLEPGYVKPEPVAWYCSHLHTRDGDAPYQYCYLFKQVIDLPPGARSIRFPRDGRVRIFAATALRSGRGAVVAATPLFDVLGDHTQDAPRITPAEGAFTDTVEVRVLPRLYWRPGAIHYTLDGSEPTADSPAYATAFALSRSAVVKAAVLGSDGRPGPVASAGLEIHDTTPPTLQRVGGIYGMPTISVEFSEPVDGSATITKNYSLDPVIEVLGARANPDGRSVTLLLSAAPQADRAYRVKVEGIQDASPAHNRMKPAQIDLTVRGPVFTLASVDRDRMGAEVRDVPGLPVRGSDPWSINMFVRAQTQPPNRTVIAGFGRCDDAADGTGRYLCKFANGVHFWSRNRDAEGRAPLDLDRWQMLTATYDGRTLRLFKDAQRIGEREVQLSDDEAVVRLTPPDPWEHKRRFEGEIRGLTIWPDVLSDEAVQSLMDAVPPP